MISEQQLREYDESGVLIIEELFDSKEVDILRQKFHDQLLKIGIDHHKILNGEIEYSVGPRIKGKTSRIFYAKWKLDVLLDEKVYGIMKQLLLYTYGSNRKEYSHPFGRFTDVVPYIDRVCWRLPDVIRAEDGLGLHLDRNPYDPYLLKTSKGLSKWRPIQALLVLTDHWGTDTGGLQVVKGFHKEIDTYFANNIQVSDGGEFCRLNNKSHAKLEKRLQPINASKGSLICWDNRLPHATTKFLSGVDTRECVYIGYLPNVQLNKQYHGKQLINLNKNIAPPAYLETDNETVDKDWEVNELSELQKKLLGFL